MIRTYLIHSTGCKHLGSEPLRRFAKVTQLVSKETILPHPQTAFRVCGTLPISPAGGALSLPELSVQAREALSFLFILELQQDLMVIFIMFPENTNLRLKQGGSTVQAVCQKIIISNTTNCGTPSNCQKPPDE